jgi:hypothetical protein
MRNFPALCRISGNSRVPKGLWLLVGKFAMEMRAFGTAPAMNTARFDGSGLMIQPSNIEDSESRLGVCLRFAEVDVRVLQVAEMAVIVPVAGPEFSEEL